MALGRMPNSASLLNPNNTVCASSLGASSVYRLLHDEGDQLFPDALFADLYQSKGRASVSPRILSTVLLLQRLEGLSDREAVDRFRYDVRWKFSCGALEADFPVFVHTVLVYFREKLRNSEHPNRIFEVTLNVARKAGLLGRRRVLDSTALYDSVATQDTVTMIRMSIRGLLREADAWDAELASAIRGSLKRDDNYADAGKPVCDWNDAEGREGVIHELATDGVAALAVLEGRVLPSAVSRAGELLATVLGQDIEVGLDGRFVIIRGVAKDRVISTVDPEARHGHKTASRQFDGFKGHVAIDPDSEIVTGAVVTAGNEADGNVAAELLSDILFDGQPSPSATTEPTVPSEPTRAAASEESSPEGEESTPPAANPPTASERPEVYGDSSYGTAEVHKMLQAAGIDAYTKTQGPASREGMFSQNAFGIDLAARIVTCPNNLTATLHGDEKHGWRAHFGAGCRDCPWRGHCTASKGGRTVSIHPEHELLSKVRAQQARPEWRRSYEATRPKVERKQAHMMRRKHGSRRARVRGLKRVAADFSVLAAVTNLQRLAKLGLKSVENTWVAG